ncbi:urease subunit beta [Alicyclobacillus herbarius]|uniref:urease subunit beta n=1 Tax=Alicyclobacillus herbarius TaxID=122960 RepID=UPI000422C0D4|nr:urease subunit beta [Alicyclobacillus herbarius]
MIPGEYLLLEDPIACNVGRPVVTVTVVNRGDRPVQVGSHYHFYEVNEALAFDRAQAWGTRLNIPSGTAARFEPGDARTVELVPFVGERRVHGFNSRAEGPLEGKTEP